MVAIATAPVVISAPTAVENPTVATFTKGFSLRLFVKSHHLLKRAYFSARFFFPLAKSRFLF